MHENPTLRILLDLFLAVTVIFGAWYIALPIALISAWAFPAYVEIIFLGLLYDGLFGMGRELGIAGYLGIIVSVLSFAATAFLKLIVRK
jgi:hypothetical protein